MKHISFKDSIDEDAEREAKAIHKHRIIAPRSPHHAKASKLMVGSKFDPPSHAYDKRWDYLLMEVVKKEGTHNYTLVRV